MENLNRIKVVLVKQQKTGKWLAEQMGKSACTVSPIWPHWIKSPHCWMWIGKS